MAIPERPASSDENSVVQYKRSQGQQVCDKLKTITKRKAVSLEDTQEQGTVALNNYLSKVMYNDKVKPAENFEIQLPTSHRIIQFASPTSINDKETQTDPIESDPYSKEILRQADSFKNTEAGHVISDRVAKELNLREVTQNVFDEFMDRIPATLRNVRGGAGFNAKTLGAIFFCLGQVTKKALENYVIAEAKKYIRLCFAYVERKLSVDVQQHGGYEAILGIAFWKTVRKCCLSLGVVFVASGSLYYIWKK